MGDTNQFYVNEIRIRTASLHSRCLCSVLVVRYSTEVVDVDICNI